MEIDSSFPDAEEEGLRQYPGRRFLGEGRSNHTSDAEKGRSSVQEL